MKTLHKLKLYCRKIALPGFSGLILFLFITQITFAQDNKVLFQKSLNEAKEKNRLDDSDISEWKVSSQYTDKTTGITHAYLQQYYKNIAVYNAISVYAIKDNKVVHFIPGVISHLKDKLNTNRASITPQGAIDAAARYLEIQPGRSEITETDETENKYYFNAPELSRKKIKVQLVYTLEDNRVLLAWNVSIDMKDGSHWWNIRVDANTGAFISKNDFVATCNYNDAETDEEEMTTLNNSALMVGGGSYNVVPFPTEAPNYGSRSLLVDPANATASPYGWHDVNGIIGPDFTITRGNNVYAYEDSLPPDGPPGYSPNGGPTLNFNYPLNLTINPANNIDASITNMFYAVNALHDKLYSFGFDEPAGNFQVNNYGNGGLGADAVQAENFDYSGMNNANFGTPEDGQEPRMQMYLWESSSGCDNLNITSIGYNGPMTCAKGTFSPIATVTASMILVNDGSGVLTDGCGPPINNVAGKIVLIDRGTCTFVSKVLEVQAAGAVGVIIANNNPLGGVTVMGGSGPVTIPSIMVSYQDGIILKTQLASGAVTATITTCVPPLIDGSFDNGIIAHEFGHGLSNRLTGGPAQAGCLSNNENGSEGWSDWLALISTMKAGDVSSAARTMGSFVRGQPANGSGLRRYPYSTDMSINPQTYADLTLSNEIHDVGEIWCDVIWDLTRNLTDQFGFDANSANAAAGNNIAMRLVLEGMKLQACNPGFLDSRDGILTADHILYNDAHRCLIWQTFARRGMGFYANQGNKAIAGDETADFTEAFCVACAGTPVGGTAHSSVPQVCATEEFHLTLSGNSVFSGLTFQWQSSPNNATWTNIAGATSYQYLGTEGASTWYRCMITCTAASDSDESDPVYVAFINDCIAMTNGQVHVCNATFYDTGFEPGNYSDMQSLVQTFVPDLNKRIKLSWDYFESEQDYDYVTIYNGPDDTYPVLYGPLSGTLSIPDFISTHPSGTLTVKFTSDEAVTARGWRAHVLCVACPYFDDSNPCTVDGCDPVTGQPNHLPVPINASAVITTSILCYGGTACANIYVDNLLFDAICGLTGGFHTIPIENGDGCQGSLTFEVPSPLKLTVGTSSTPTTCFNNSGSVTAVPNDGTPGYLFEWKNSASVIVGTTNVVSGLPGGTYTVKVTDSNGCTETGTATIIAIGSAPSTPGSITGPGGVCKGQMGVQFCVTPVAGALSYLWILPNGVMGSSTSNCITVNISTNFTGGTICVQAVNVCGNSMSSCKILTIVTAKPAKPGPITGPSPLCGGTSVTFCVPPVFGATSYVWSIGGNGGSNPLTMGAGQGTNCITINIPAGYNAGQEIKVKAQNCKGTSDERKLKITVIPIPAMPGAISGLNSICKSAIGFYSISTVANATTYSWSVTGNVWIAGGQGTKSLALDFFPSNASSAVLSVRAGNVCGLSPVRTKTITINNCREADNIVTAGTGNIEDVRVYPNPTHNEVNIDFVTAAESNCLLTLTDITGKLVMQTEIKSVSGPNQYKFEINSLAQGAYLLMLNTEEGRSVTRLFVE